MDASSITLNVSVIILGVILTNVLVCRAVYYHIKNVHCVNAFLTQDTLVTVVYAFVTYRIDNCNDLLYGISDYKINRLQLIQNSAACIVTNTRKYDNITPIIHKKHCLPVKLRFHFKILLITYNYINDMAPEYLCHPENSCQPDRYYCRSQCLGSSHMVIVPLVLCCSSHFVE